MVRRMRRQRDFRPHQHNTGLGNNTIDSNSSSDKELSKNGAYPAGNSNKLTIPFEEAISSLLIGWLPQCNIFEDFFEHAADHRLDNYLDRELVAAQRLINVLEVFGSIYSKGCDGFVVQLNKVEMLSCTVLSVVFKANEGVKHSTPLLNHGPSWKNKLLCAISLGTCWLCQPDGWKSQDKSEPLSQSLVKDTVNSLQNQHMLVFEAK